MLVVAACGVTYMSCGGGSPTSPSGPPVAVAPPIDPPHNQTPVTPTTPPAPGGGSTWINVFGDTGWCGSPAMAPLARQLSELGGDIFLAGDIAYPNGSADDFRRCYDPDFGRFRNRVWATPGNHEYVTSNAEAYFTYFGERAGPDRRGYYAIRAEAWQVLMLNSNIPTTRASPQAEWVRQQLQQNPTRCTLAVIHHPIDSSGPNGPNPGQRDLWELMYAQGVDVVVAGHDHLYERHAPADPSMRPDEVRGIRLFIVGTGGASPYSRTGAARNSELLISTYGLLRLKLEPALYEWEFRDQNGRTLDSGLNICH